VSASSAEAVSLFIVAGEPSGDAIGARLMRALRERAPEPLRFVGVGGEAMQAEGLKVIFPMSDLSVMGIGEVLPRLPRILARLEEATTAAVKLRPAAVITIDSSSFNKRLARRLQSSGLPALRIHYVAPMVWAWRPRRATKMAACFDHLLALFPFEVEIFRAAGLPTTWTGHPLVETQPGEAASFRRRYGIDPGARVVCLLPGSRMTEVQRLLPAFREAVARVEKAVGPVHTVVPTVETVGTAVEAALHAWPTDTTLIRGDIEKAAAFTASDVALAASGSVTLELARAEVPMVVAYKTSGLTAFLARRLVKLPHISLVNILAGEAVVPELLQGDCTPDLLATELSRLLMDRGARDRQRAAFREICSGLAPVGELTPSQRAADVVLGLAFADTAPQTPASLHGEVTR